MPITCETRFLLRGPSDIQAMSTAPVNHYDKWRDFGLLFVSLSLSFAVVYLKGMEQTVINIQVQIWNNTLWCESKLKNVHVLLLLEHHNCKHAI